MSGELEWGMVAGTNTVTVANDTLTTISWQNNYTPAGQKSIAYNTATAPFSILLDGWYAIFLDVQWTAGGFPDVRLYQVLGTYGFLNSDATYGTAHETSSPFLAGATFSIIGYLETHGGAQKLSSVVRQKSGGGRDLNTGHFSLVYLGPANGGIPVAVSPGTQPVWTDVDAEGVSIAFDSETHTQPLWTRVDA